MNKLIDFHPPVIHPVDDQDFPHNTLLLPKIYRLTAIRHESVGTCKTICTATLYHDHASMNVIWTRSMPDTRLKVGDLVSPRWLPLSSCDRDAIRIARLVKMERPEPWENLFHMVPHDWVSDRQLTADAAELVDVLSRPCRFLFNAVFWDGQRFHRYCTVPSMRVDPLLCENGTLHRAIEVAQLLQQMADNNEIASGSVGILAGLFHDAGTADEYVQNPGGTWDLSLRGRLLGHKLTVIEWIADARARWNILMPEELHLALLRSLSCSATSPQWFGARKPAVLEAALLANMGAIASQES